MFRRWYQLAAAVAIVVLLTITWFHAVLVWQCWLGQLSTKMPCGVAGSTATATASMNCWRKPWMSCFCVALHLVGTSRYVKLVGTDVCT
eukprot:COSAG01_NODE_10348_length_2187_cov_58.548851_1_plen_89_part_00